MSTLFKGLARFRPVKWFTCESDKSAQTSEPNAASDAQTGMRALAFKVTFVGTVVIATSGWIWLLYAGFRWLI